MAESCVIARMGPRGDGAFRGRDGELFVAYALPGESVTVASEAGRPKLVSIEQASPDRIDAICRYFGECGGCKLQHWRPEPYLDWKRALVREALHARNIDVPVDPTIDAHGAGRRRVTLHARREGSLVRSGFMQAASHAIVTIEACPILAPALAEAPRIAADIAGVLTRAGKPLDIGVTATGSGLDVSIRGQGPLAAAERERVIKLAERHDLARLSNHHEVIVERRQPLIALGECHVLPPPGAFLQATARGEEVLARLCAEGIGEARRIADLFCGIGPFALRLARTVRISAYDTDEAAIAALLKAARHAQGLKPLKAQARDLFRRPLLPAELNEFDAAILDPPRQGAERQVLEITRSKLRRIVYVSCNPSTFARDAALLIEGGYRLGAVTPVDQFRFSAHVELVGVFRRSETPAVP